MTDIICIIHELRPRELEALVSQKTQGELQTREQEEVAEINQAQDLERLHSCKDTNRLYQKNTVNWSLLCMSPRGSLGTDQYK